jgi:outer membrane receptor for ferric coprogen and ferric-rhodotorulic acid
MHAVVRVARRFVEFHAAISILLLLVPVASVADDGRVRFDIPTQALERALEAFRTQSRIQVIYGSDLVVGKMAPAVVGEFTPAVALQKLIQGSGLVLHETGNGVLVLQPAPAGGEADAAELAIVSVEDSLLRNKASTEGSGSYASGYATVGSKFEGSVRRVPQSVSVITQQRMQDQNLTTLDQALAQTTGVTVQPNATIDPNFYSRGFQLDTFQFDGVPQTYTNNFQARPDLAMYERVEVLRGASGLFNGAGQPGGVVNLVRKRPVSETQFSFTGNAGSWNNYRVETDAAGPMNEEGSLRGRFVTAFEDRDYFFDVAESRKTLLYGIVEYDLTPDTLLTLGGHIQRSDVVPYIIAHSRYNDGRDLGLPRNAFLNPAWNRWNLEAEQVFAEVEHRLDDNWKLKISASDLRDKSDRKYGHANGAVDPVTHAGARIEMYDADYSNNQTGLDAALSGTFTAYGRRHELVLGASDLKRMTRTRSVRLVTPFPATDLFTFDPYSVPEPGVPAGGSHSRTNTHQYGVYGALRAGLTDSLSLIAGGRLSWWESRSHNLVTGLTTNDYAMNKEFTPYGGLIYDLNRAWSLYASYADIFRVQNNFTFAGELLPPVTGANYEAGIKGELFDGTLNVALAVFRIDEKNRSQQDPDHPAPCPGSPTGGACFLADGEVRSEGFDAEISGQILPGWQVYGGYTYNTTEYVRDRTATGLPSLNQGRPYSTFTPEHLFRLWTNYQLRGSWSDWTVGGGVNAQSSYYATQGTTVRIEQGGLATWSARVGYRIDDHWSLALNVNNLFDKVYYQRIGGTGANNWYGEPRNFMLSVRGDFK